MSNLTVSKIIRRNIWGNGLDGDAPERYIGGIAVASTEVIKGSALLASGLSNADELIPVFLNHNEALPVGVVNRLIIKGDQVHFIAYLGQSFLCAGDVWDAIKAQELTHVSIAFDEASGKQVNSVYRRWRATEVSLVDASADPGARITKCWEVAQTSPRKSNIFWSKSNEKN